MENASARRTNGLLLAIGAFAAWGLMPLYLHLLRRVPPLELVGWRILLTVPVCLVLLAVRGQSGALRQAFGNPKVLAVLALSSALIAVNWVVYAIAVLNGHVLAASLGYYINPLVSVLGGTLLFRERLSRARWIAVALAAAGVSLLALGALEMLWISLTLALSFGGYGIVRKLAPVDSLPGLAAESLLLALPAAAVIGWQAATPQGWAIGSDIAFDLTLAMAGIVTATPLLLFTSAARRLDLSLVGFMQFIAPSVQFVLGIVVFGEVLRPLQIGCFALIWSAIAVFCRDLYVRR